MFLEIFGWPKSNTPLAFTKLSKAFTALLLAFFWPPDKPKILFRPLPTMGPAIDPINGPRNGARGASGVAERRAVAPIPIACPAAAPTPAVADRAKPSPDI